MPERLTQASTVDNEVSKKLPDLDDGSFLGFRYDLAKSGNVIPLPRQWWGGLEGKFPLGTPC